MRSYYCHFKKTAVEKCKQVVNTDYFGEKKKKILFPIRINKENQQEKLIPPLAKRTVEKSEKMT